jgi:hypothetical protein
LAATGRGLDHIEEINCNITLDLSNRDSIAGLRVIDALSLFL